MSADRITGGAMFIVAVVLYWLGSSASNPEAFLFPRLISIAIGVLGIAVLASTPKQQHREASTARPAVRWLTVIPVLLAFLAYRWAMEAVGFYVAGFATFVFIVSVYAPDPYSPRAIVKRVAVSAAFIGVIYAIFALLLRVQTPRGVLI